MWNMKVTGIQKVVGAFWNSSERFGKREWGNWRSEKESRRSRPHHC